MEVSFTLADVIVTLDRAHGDVEDVPLRRLDLVFLEMEALRHVPRRRWDIIIEVILKKLPIYGYDKLPKQLSKDDGDSR